MDKWRALVEHLPFVMAVASPHGQQTTQIDVKSLLTAVAVSVLTALGSSYATTKELSVEMRIIAQQVAITAAKQDDDRQRLALERQALAERLARIEATSGMSSMSGSDRRPR
jgi:hypothetical protein